MSVKLTIVSLVAVLFSSVSLFAIEPQAPLPQELVISAGPWEGVSVDEFLEKMLDFADKVSRSHNQRDIRPSDRLFDCVMRHVANLSPTCGDQRAKLVELMDSKDSRARYFALAIIARDWSIASQGSTTFLKDNAALQARLLELLQDELWETADAAALQLSVLNHKEWPRALTDYVVKQLKSEHVVEQVRSARLVRTATNPPANVKDHLLAALKHRTPEAERSEFAWALFHYGKIPAESVPTFISAMQSSVALPAVGGMCCASRNVENESRLDNIRREFHAILPLLSTDAISVIPALIELLNSADIQTRRSAVVILGKFGPLAKEALPHLKSMETTHVETRHSMIFGRFSLVTKIDEEVAKACEQITRAPRLVVHRQGFEPSLFDVCEFLRARAYSRMTDLVRQITEMILDGMGFRSSVNKRN